MVDQEVRGQESGSISGFRDELDNSTMLSSTVTTHS